MVLSIVAALPLPHHHLPPTAREPRGRKRSTRRATDEMDVDSSSSTGSRTDDEDGSDYDDRRRRFDLSSETTVKKTMIITPGEPIGLVKDLMRGHGTYVTTLNEDENGSLDGYDEMDEDGNERGQPGERERWVMSSVAGVLEQQNKLVIVNGVRGKYVPAIGDLLIGRITDVRQSTWKVDVGSRLEGSLGLGSVNLPGGVLRRKLESDVLRMRELLKEGDLLVVEVQGLKADGGMELHTRSLKYGKLRNGLLITLSPHLIRRLKTHYITLQPFGLPATSSSARSSESMMGSAVELILGVNGYVWVMGSSGEKDEDRRVMGFQGGAGTDEETALKMYSDQNDDVPPLTRLSISLTAQLILLFAKYSIPLTDVLLIEGLKICEHYRWGGSTGGMSAEMERMVVAAVCGVGEGEVELV